MERDRSRVNEDRHVDIASGEISSLPLTGKCSIWRSTSPHAEDRSVGRVEILMPLKESLLSRGTDPPNNTSVLTCATAPCSVLRSKDVRTGNGCCITLRQCASLYWFSLQRLIPTMRSRASSAPTMSRSVLRPKFASTTIGKAGQISSVAFMSLSDLHTSCKLRWPARPKTRFLHLPHMCANLCHGHVPFLFSDTRRYESNMHRRTSSESLSSVNLSKL